MCCLFFSQILQQHLLSDFHAVTARFAYNKVYTLRKCNDKTNKYSETLINDR